MKDIHGGALVEMVKCRGDSRSKCDIEYLNTSGKPYGW